MSRCLSWARVGFEIRESPRNGRPDAPISPDVATCSACLSELFDPGDRRFRYPFINCTDCGPRFTIVTGVPYDRPWTTMAGFEMCAACQAEYDDPRDRRFHAQPNACPACGPRAWLVAAGEAAARQPDAVSPAPDAISAAAHALLSGAIVAVKGVGGFHLACRADDEAAVARLRARKHREDRPFAVMVRDVETAATLVDLGGGQDFGSGSAKILATPLAPIVIAPRRPDADVAPSVAPRSNDLGVMLPYTPLHHLLLADVGVPLVMTSGNVSDEPIAYESAEALTGIADLFLLHDRPIHTRVDDSVVRGGRVVRRSRGYVPSTLPVASAPPLLAVGAELKNTFALARDGRAWVSHHIGDLRNYETLRSFSDGIAHFQRLFAVEPELVAHDLHPEYLSTKYALDLELRGGRRPAPPRPPGGCAGRARRGAGGGRDLRRHGLRHRRHRLGRRAAARRPRSASSGSATCGRSACPAARRRSASRGGWPAPGCWRSASRCRRSGSRSPRSPAPAWPRR